MSRIRANTITNQNANGAPNFPDGITVSGVVTATVSNSTLGTLAVTGNATVGGTLGVGGTLTYEDVTNIDSVGVITARTDINLGDSIIHIGDTNTKIRFPAADTITAETGGAEKLRIDPDGRILFGATGGNSASARAIFRGFAGDGGAGQGLIHLEVNKTTTNCGANESLGSIRFASNEGHIGAQISASAESAWSGSGDLPTFIRFNTCPDGSSTMAERFRIGSAGQLGIGGATYGTSGQALVSQGASSAPQWASVGGAAGSVYDTFHGQGFNTGAGNGYITSGWGKPGGPGASWANGPAGKLITESSGIFSFPSTGIYYVSFQLTGYAQNVNNRIIGNRIYGTSSNQNPPPNEKAHAQFNVKSYSGIDNGVGYGSALAECILKIVNISNDKVAFWWQSEDSAHIGGGAAQMAIFYKLADI